MLVTDDLVIRTGNLLAVWVNMVAFSVGYTLGTEQSLNEHMIAAGYAWEYDGGTKQKNFEELREIRRKNGTLSKGYVIPSHMDDILHLPYLLHFSLLLLRGQSMSRWDPMATCF